MKALIINSQGSTEEAFALAKVALRNDMKSHVCWHVYGLLWRSEKNFEEAIKAYKFALKLEPDSQQIQRDLALLQIQMRDYEGYIQSRRAMLQARSGVRQHWTALAIAYHLAGNLTEAENVLTTYEETLKSPISKLDIEHSEAVLYKNTIIAETGEIERALDHLEAVGKSNLDKTAVMEMRADYLSRLGRKKEAETAYRALLERNAEYKTYYAGLQDSLDMDKSDLKSLKALYDDYAAKNPRGDAARRIPLEFLHGDDFREAADKYLQRMLNKGVPSTFANVKSLYSDASKRDAIEQLVEGYRVGKYSHQANGSAEPQVNGDVSTFELSALYFLAQHYNYHLSRNLEKAMQNIDEAIERSSKSVDYHMTKARIWKHYGNTRKASETMAKARSLDDKDRYINSKAAKYQLRNDENDAAIQTMSKFTRNETLGGALGDLHDMQCMWYITEDGESYLRQGKLGLALKRFTAIYNIFDVWQEDQFDFHSFSLRKGQIRAYVDMVRWEDHLRQHPFYSRAAVYAIKGYIALYDNPQLAHGPLTNGMHSAADLDKLDSNERKKAMKKAKRDQQKQEKVDAGKQEAKKASTAGTDQNGDKKKEDADPLGKILAQTADPLKDAMKFLGPLLEFSAKNIKAQNVGFGVFVRRSKFPYHTQTLCSVLMVRTEKYALALRCLLAAHSIDPSDPTLHEQIIHFRRTLDSLPSPLPAKLAEVITPEFATILPNDTDPSTYNDDFLARHKHSAAHIQAYVKVRQTLTPDSLEQNQKDLLAALDLDHISLQDIVAGLDLLKSWKSEKKQLDDYVTRARQRWPEATAFQQGD